MSKHILRSNPSYVMCGKSFAEFSSLFVHRRKHSSVNVNVCDNCGKRFSRTNSLTTHEGFHSEGTPNVCDECFHKWSHVGESGILKGKLLSETSVERN